MTYHAHPLLPADPPAPARAMVDSAGVLDLSYVIDVDACGSWPADLVFISESPSFLFGTSASVAVVSTDNGETTCSETAGSPTEIFAGTM